MVFKNKINMEFQPVGVVISPHKNRSGMPIQPTFAKGCRGKIIIDKKYTEGLKDLDGFSHIIVIFHLHQSSGYKLSVVPYLDNTPHGLFATRTPNRPNPVGLSVVKLIEVKGNELIIENIDMLDGTPVIDIKPYIPDFDEATEVKTGWYKNASGDKGISDNRFCK